jgi:hypothetical protein
MMSIESIGSQLKLKEFLSTKNNVVNDALLTNTTEHESDEWYKKEQKKTSESHGF